MLYDLLKAYKLYLLDSLRPASAQTYYKRLALLLQGQSISDPVGRLDIDKVLHKLGKIKYKNHFSQSKNALLHFCEYQGINLSYDTLKSIKAFEEATKKKRRGLKAIEYQAIDHKIKRLKNKRLQLSYQVMIATGLRVSELSGISPSDCIVQDDGITLQFTGKGGNHEEVSLLALEHPQLYEGLKKQLDDSSSSKKVFYSAIYLQTKAKELGFKCHDLRRACAKLEYKKSGSKLKVMEKMRHASIKNTKIYLRSKIKI